MPLSREADRERKRLARERARAERAAASVVVEFPAPSDVADAVRSELADLPGAITHPGLVAAAMTMARILDDPKEAAHHAAAARALGDMLARLHEVRSPSGGKLAALRLARSDDPA